MTPHGANSVHLNACALLHFSGTRSIFVSSCLPVQDNDTAFMCELQCKKPFFQRQLGGAHCVLFIVLAFCILNTQPFILFRDAIVDIVL